MKTPKKVEMTKDSYIKCICRMLKAMNNINTIESLYKITLDFYKNEWFKHLEYKPGCFYFDPFMLLVLIVNNEHTTRKKTSNDIL